MENDLWRQQLEGLGFREEDVEESFVRSGGHGGQNVNKVATCVMLIHRPTGITVKCQSTRYQGRNRELARELLLEKIRLMRAKAVSQARMVAEKEKRRKRGLSRAAKLRNLAEKSRQKAKKANRRYTRDE